MAPLDKTEVARGLVRLPASHTVCRSRILPIEMARNVTVVPVELRPGYLPFGGPIWPNWRTGFSLRLSRGGVVIDDRPPMPQTPAPQGPDEAVWGGTMVGQFGHFIADHSARLVLGALAKPDLPILVGLPGGDAASPLPANVSAVLDWYGIDAGRIVPVTSPMTVKQLWVAPQTEQLDGGLPPQPWIDRQTAHAAQVLPDPPQSDIVYVSRAGFASTGRCLACEAALTDALARAGVTVIAPERLPLKAQLGHYLGAKVIVFAEGSAIHGLELLGRIKAHVVVLNRRPQRRFGVEAIGPRVHALSFVEATATLLNLPRLSRAGNYASGLSVPDMDVIARTFAAFGIDISADLPRMAAERDANLAAWMTAALSTEPAEWRARTDAAFATRLRSVGLGHILDAVMEVPHET
jgi:hypothetical protein